MQDLQLQRETFASLNDQHEKHTMFANAENTVSSLGFTPETVIRQREDLDGMLRNMDQLRQTVQYGVLDSQLSTSELGGLGPIMDILTEVDDGDEIELFAPVVAEKKAILQQTEFGDSDTLQDVDMDNGGHRDMKIEVASNRHRQPPPSSAVQSSTRMQQPPRRRAVTITPGTPLAASSAHPKAELKALGT
jgi:hypothetical protein